jgi:hypothetical protein
MKRTLMRELAHAHAELSEIYTYMAENHIECNRQHKRAKRADEVEFGVPNFSASILRKNAGFNWALAMRSDESHPAPFAFSPPPSAPVRNDAALDAEMEDDIESISDSDDERDDAEEEGDEGSNLSDGFIVPDDAEDDSDSDTDKDSSDASAQSAQSSPDQPDEDDAGSEPGDGGGEDVGSPSNKDDGPDKLCLLDHDVEYGRHMRNIWRAMYQGLCLLDAQSFDTLEEVFVSAVKLATDVYAASEQEYDTMRAYINDMLCALPQDAYGELQKSPPAWWTPNMQFARALYVEYLARCKSGSITKKTELGDCYAQIISAKGSPCESDEDDRRVISMLHGFNRSVPEWLAINA